MNKKLLFELTKMDDVDFFTLEHHFHFARMIRDVIVKRGLTEKEMAEIIGVPPNKMKSVLNGSYEFDLRLISKLQAYNQMRASADAKLKIEAETIQFATYKDQYPLYVSRIEKLLKILEVNTGMYKPIQEQNPERSVASKVQSGEQKSVTKK
jgi:plasmid maintenance system antidote protein VapI